MCNHMHIYLRVGPIEHSEHLFLSQCAQNCTESSPCHPICSPMYRPFPECGGFEILDSQRNHKMYNGAYFKVCMHRVRALTNIAFIGNLSIRFGLQSSMCRAILSVYLGMYLFIASRSAQLCPRKISTANNCHQ